MKGSGYFRDRVVWMRQRESKSGDAGAVGEIFDDVQTLWCRIREPRGADKIYWSALQSTIDCAIELRGAFGVRAVDRFRDEATEAVYLLVGPPHLDDIDGVNEVCPCAKFPEKTSEDVP